MFSRTSELSALSSLSSTAKNAAYCPYSKFRVGCTVLTSGGEFISGANVENASYNVGTCAERVTLGRAVVQVLEKGHGLAGESKKFRYVTMEDHKFDPRSDADLRQGRSQEGHVQSDRDLDGYYTTSESVWDVQTVHKGVLRAEYPDLYV